MMRILIVGATSAIAEATARIWAVEGHDLFLVGRHQARLQAVAADFRLRGASHVGHAEFDAMDSASHALLVRHAIDDLGGLDMVLVAHGSLGDQTLCETDFASANQQFTVNALSVISVLTHVANYFEAQRGGSIVVIGSVAGDRGRKSNYVYGSAKAAVEVFIQGLRNRLHRSGVHVMLVKPGLIDTPMTSALRKGVLWSSPETVARCITGGLAKRRHVVYAPSFWRAVMTVIRWIPEPIFKTLSL